MAHLLDYADLTAEQRAFCRAYFEREVFPVLTPLAFDRAAHSCISRT